MGWRPKSMLADSTIGNTNVFCKTTSAEKTMYRVSMEWMKTRGYPWLPTVYGNTKKENNLLYLLLTLVKFISSYISVPVEAVCWNKPKETGEAPFMHQVASWLCVVEDFFFHTQWMGFPQTWGNGLMCITPRSVDSRLGPWVVGGSNASAAVNPAPVTDRHACGQPCIPEPNTALSGTPPSPLFNPHHNKFAHLQ